jgi:hypothetical protein
VAPLPGVLANAARMSWVDREVAGKRGMEQSIYVDFQLVNTRVCLAFGTARLDLAAVPRARIILLNAALGPLDYRVPNGERVEPGSIVVAPLGRGR